MTSRKRSPKRLIDSNFTCTANDGGIRKKLRHPHFQIRPCATAFKINTWVIDPIIDFDIVDFAVNHL